MRVDKEDFAGRVALITGGSRGIGFATAQAFLERGARVAICGKDRETLTHAEGQLGRLGEVEAVPADVRDGQQVRNFVTQVRARFGRLDVLVNNAGRVWAGSFAEQPWEAIDEVVDVNVKGVLYATRAALPALLEQREGVIVNVSSGVGLTGFPEIVAYCASKFAVVGFTESLDQEVRGDGIGVHGLCPGRVEIRR
jgi:3-oxoacyl-[acyl-carrier protein] reductase